MLHAGMRNAADFESARPALRWSRRARDVPVHMLSGRQHAVQRAGQQRGFCRAGFLRPAPDASGRRHGGAARRGRALAQDDGPAAIIEGYGLSETAPVATVNPTNTPEFSGSIGLPVPSTDVAILDDDGNAVPEGERGEVRIKRAAGSCAGVLAAPRGNARSVMTADGYFRTGGYRHDGRTGLHPHRRPQERHDRRVRVQGLPERGRGSHRGPSRTCWKSPPSAWRTSGPEKSSRSSSCRAAPRCPRPKSTPGAGKS